MRLVKDVAGISLDKNVALVIALARRFFACRLAGFIFAALVNGQPLLSHQVVGGDSEYIVQPGDFLIAAHTSSFEGPEGL